MALSEQTRRRHAPERRQAVDDSVPPPWVGERMTLDEFLALPPVKPNVEYVDGVVEQKMAAKPVHGSLQSFLAEVMNQTARPRRLGKAYSETRFVTPTWSPVPDVSYYRRERIHRRGRRAPEDFLEAPDIAVEIVSPDQSVTRLIEKCLRYVSLGAQVTLLIDPDDEAVLAFRAGRPVVVLQGHERIDLDDALPGFDLTVSGLFDEVAPDWLDEEPPEAAASEPERPS